MSAVVEAKNLTDKEKDDLLKEVLGQDYATAGNNLPLLKGIIDKIGNIDNLFTITELIPIVNKILSIRIFSFLATGASVVSIFLLPISAMVNIINGYQLGRKMYSYRAIAYALTSWAFDKPILTSSKKIMLQAKTGMPKVDVKELIEYEKSWKKASQDVVNKMSTIAINNNIPKEAIKIFLRAIADNNEQKLCEIFLKGFEREFNTTVINIWKSNYKVRYPN